MSWADLQGSVSLVDLLQAHQVADAIDEQRTNTEDTRWRLLIQILGKR